MAGTASNKIKFEIATKYFVTDSNVFKLAIMDTGYSFDKDTDHGYADVSASEMATAFGYTAGGITLTGITLTEDDTNDRCSVVWSTVSLAISGGDFGPTPGYIIYNDTPTTPTADPIIGYVAFSSTGLEYTQDDGGTAKIITPTIYLT